MFNTWYLYKAPWSLWSLSCLHRFAFELHMSKTTLPKKNADYYSNLGLVARWPRGWCIILNNKTELSRRHKGLRLERQTGQEHKRRIDQEHSKTGLNTHKTYHKDTAGKGSEKQSDTGSKTGQDTRRKYISE